MILPVFPAISENKIFAAKKSSGYDHVRFQTYEYCSHDIFELTAKFPDHNVTRNQVSDSFDVKDRITDQLALTYQETDQLTEYSEMPVNIGACVSAPVFCC